MAEDPNLVIDDDYIEGIGASCSLYGDSIDDLFRQYIQVLDDVANKAVPSGEFHDAIVAFKSVVSQLRNQGKDGSKLNEIDNNINNICSGFISKIGEDSKPLY
ncbi:hypothetical protein OZX72_00130 [Bifidobacterium sp. ESL0769]|uniref:hypothetical protein n=1 Tax=Bifidobacterium sp. ESL0769 TaxID=2983229 RepID=UPI0023F92394|nr:hypothetical protein [Bifidobacterium sp. ESL0769]WEV67463.1 hypothetical protein OZX72_00130 [Bifidobacterium sp. ESL0769]